MDSSPDLSPFLLDLDLDLDLGSKDSDLDLDLKAMDLDLDSDLEVLPASPFSSPLYEAGGYKNIILTSRECVQLSELCEILEPF